MEAGLLYHALIFLVAAVAVVPLFKWLGLGEVLGYLVAGVAIGPSALGLVADADQVLRFSQVGIVFLLFVIGLELKPARLKLMRRPVFVFGGLQVATVTTALGLAGWLAGLSPLAALVVGFSLALGSTPLVLQLLGERRELQSRHGRHAFSILLFQDLAAIPALAVIPLLGAGVSLDEEPLALVREAALVLGAFLVLIVGGRFLMRPLFRIAAGTRSREMFAGAALTVVIGAALLMDLAGLSMALGAFIAGVLLADSEYRHAIEADIEPYKGLLLGLFFMAVGMTTQIGLLGQAPGQILALVAALVAIKAAAMLIAARLYRLPWRETVRLGVLLAHGGEFGFVLLSAALNAELLEQGLVDRLILVVSLSMATTAPLYAAALRWGERLFASPAPKRAFDVPADDTPRVLIVGFSRFGQVVGRVLQGLKIPYTVLDSNPEQVDFVRRYGNRVYYGDATRHDLLKAAGAERASILVLAIGEVETSVRIARLVKRRFPRLRVLARARNRYHAHLLMRIGVHGVIRELLLSSLEMSRQLLSELGVPEEQARHTIETFRVHDEQALAQQLEVFGNEQKLIQSVQEAAKELRALYEADEDSVTPGSLSRDTEPRR